MSKKKYRLVEEEELANLLVSSMKLNNLELGGVDNWSHYSDALNLNYEEKEIIEGYATDEDGYIDYESTAIDDLEDYTLIEVELYVEEEEEDKIC